MQVLITQAEVNANCGPRIHIAFLMYLLNVSSNHIRAHFIHS